MVCDDFDCSNLDPPVDVQLLWTGQDVSIRPAGLLSSGTCLACSVAVGGGGVEGVLALPLSV